MGELPKFGCLLHGQDLVESVCFCARQAEGCLHNPITTFGHSAKVATEVSDDGKAVVVEVFIDGIEGTALKCAGVFLFDDRSELEGNLWEVSWYVW